MDEDKIAHLLKELGKIEEKIVLVDKEMQEADFDLEDMMGHDDSGATSVMTKRDILSAQKESIKKELKDLGYKKI